jgi:hypothetical protein
VHILYTIYKDAKGIEFDLGEHISSRKKLKKKPEKRGHTLLQPEKECWLPPHSSGTALRPWGG